MGSQELDRPVPLQSPSDQRGPTPCLVAPQRDNTSSGLHTHDLHSSQSIIQSDPPSECGTAVRKSTRSINPVRQFTYETRGEPSYQLQGRVSFISAYRVPQMPAWEIQSQHIPQQYLALPYHWLPCASVVPCNRSQDPNLKTKP